MPSAALAHNVNVFAYVEGTSVVTESYFNDGRKCQDSTIEVFDAQGNKLLEGMTDGEGRFSFAPPVRTDLLIRLTASMGHQAEYTIPASDLPESLPASGKAIAPEKPSAEAIQKDVRPPEKPSLRPEETPVLQTPAIGTTTPSTAEIEQAVERALARQLAPIHRALEEARARQRFSDIVGGIGYIVGLMGLVLYFHSRRRRQL